MTRFPTRSTWAKAALIAGLLLSIGCQGGRNMIPITVVPRDKPGLPTQVETADILAFEERFKVRMPEQLREFYLAYNGGMLEPCQLYMQVDGRWESWGGVYPMDPLFAPDDLRADLYSGVSTLADSMEGMEGRIPVGSIPISSLSADPILIMTQGPERGRIYLYELDYEPNWDEIGEPGIEPTSNMILLADSLFEFFAMLRPFTGEYLKEDEVE